MGQTFAISPAFSLWSMDPCFHRGRRCGLVCSSTNARKAMGPPVDGFVLGNEPCYPGSIFTFFPLVTAVGSTTQLFLQALVERACKEE